MKFKITKAQKWADSELCEWYTVDCGRGITAQTRAESYRGGEAYNLATDAANAAIEMIHGRKWSEPVEAETTEHEYTSDAEIEAAGWADRIRDAIYESINNDWDGLDALIFG